MPSNCMFRGKWHSGEMVFGGNDTQSLTETLTKRLDGLYTRLLRFALKVSWKDKWTKTRQYKGLPKLSDKLRVRKMKLAGHLSI